jgi:hypothetical protein
VIVETGGQDVCRPIIVLGIHRSGTSMVSQVIHRWGAYAGDLALHGTASEVNPQGFWEYEPMQDFLWELERSTEMSIWNPELQDAVRQRAFDPRYRDKAAKLVSQMEVPGTPWCWKEPNLCLFLPFWERLWRRPVFVVTLRNPHDSARSFEKMVLPPALLGRVRLTAYFSLFWQFFMTTVLEYLEGKPWIPVLFLSYEELLRDPRGQCDRLCRFLDQEFGWSGGAGERLSAMSAGIDPGLWRNRDERSFFAVPEASETQKDLFRLLLSRTHDQQEAFDASRYQLPAGALEYLGNVSILTQDKAAPSLPSAS